MVNTNMTIHNKLNSLEDIENVDKFCVDAELRVVSEISKLEKRKTNWYLYFCSIAVNLIILPPASMSVWTSSVIPQLKSNNSEINPLERPITTLEESLLASIIAPVTILGVIILPQLLNSFSRNRGTILSALAMLISLSTIAFARNIYIYFAALSIFAIGKCGAFIIVPLYIKEIAESHNRGRLGCFFTATIPIGNFFGFIVGPRTNITVFTLFYCVPILLYMLLYVFIPESPAFFISRKKSIAAIKSLEKLRSHMNYSTVYKEYTEIEEQYLSGNTSNLGFFDCFKTKSNRKAISLVLVAGIVFEACGISVILTFAGSIFHDISEHLSGNTIVTIIGAANVFSFLIASYAVEVLGRRPLMLVSTFFSGFFLFFLALFFYIRQFDSVLAHSISWLPVICISGYILSFGMGIGSLGIPLITDLCDSNIMSSVIGMYLITSSITNFIVTFTFPFVNKHFGSFCSFWLFSVSSFICFIFFYFYLFETKGKTAAEIKRLLNK